MDENILINKWHAVPLTQRNAAGIISSMEQLSSKAGISTPRVYLVDKVPGFGNLGVINAAAAGSDQVLLTRGILESFGITNLNAPLNKRLQAVIGHELSHCKNFRFETFAKLAPPLLIPLATTLGLFFYKKVKEHNSKKDKHDTLNAEADYTEAQIKKEDGSIEPWQKKVIVTAQYMAAAALGLGAGILMTRSLSNHFENRADSFSKKIMGDGRSLAEGLAIIYLDTSKLLQEKGFGDMPKWKRVLASVLQSHPNTQKRMDSLLR